MSDAAFASTLTHSVEYYTNIIDSDYTKFLGRLPMPSETAYYLAELQGGQSDENLLAGFAGSAEFYKTSGGTPASWISALYQDILSRSPSPSELTYYETSIADGESRTAISHSLALSPEHEMDVITYDYGRYLDRTPSTPELNSWVAAFDGGESNEDIVAAFVGSPEFSADHVPAGSSPGVAAADIVDAAYKTIFGPAPTPTELSAGVNDLLPSPTSAIPTSGEYNVTVSGTINTTTSFSQTGFLVVAPTVTTTGSQINPRDIGFDVGDPSASGGPTGSLAFATNLYLFGLPPGSTPAPKLVLAAVAANTTTGAVTVDVANQSVNTSLIYQNSFDTTSSLFLVSGGTITLQFSDGGQSVTGTISLQGAMYGSSTVVKYVAKVTGTLQS